MRTTAWASLGVLVLAGCGANYADGALGQNGILTLTGDAGSNSAVTSGACGADGWDNYAAAVFATQCETCHQHTTEFSSVSAVVAKETTIRSYISQGLMPQGSPMPADQQARLFAWFDCGAPATGTGAYVDAGPAAATICSNPPSQLTDTYGQGWSGDGSSNMLPGQNCLNCHAPGQYASGERTIYAGGTVYQTPSSNTGVSSVLVKIVDSAGSTFTATTHSSGNFYFDSYNDPGLANAVPPYTISITPSGGTETFMQNAAPHLACNVCHNVPPQCMAPGHVAVALQ